MYCDNNLLNQLIQIRIEYIEKDTLDKGKETEICVQKNKQQP